MAPTIETTNNAATAARPQTLAEKLAAKQAEAANSSANILPLDLNYDNERLEWSCGVEQFLNSVKASQSGQSEGLMVKLSGKFDFRIDGKTYTFRIDHAKGGGAWVMVKMVK